MIYKVTAGSLWPINTKRDITRVEIDQQGRHMMKIVFEETSFSYGTGIWDKDGYIKIKNSLGDFPENLQIIMSASN